MLNAGFLASDCVYLSIAHNIDILKKYESILDEIFFQISLCEKDIISIDKILKHPISHSFFERLN